MIRRPKCAMVQNIKAMVNALAIQEATLTMKATDEVSGANMEKKRLIIMKRGAPGGWPTSILYDVEINSAQSQRLADGSAERTYTSMDMAKAIHPVIKLDF